MDAARLATEITNTENLLDALSAAIASLADPNIRTYTLDSGQTVTRVERNSLRDLIVSQSSLENRLTTLLARQKGNGVLLSVPGW